MTDLNKSIIIDGKYIHEFMEIIIGNKGIVELLPYIGNKESICDTLKITNIRNKQQLVLFFPFKRCDSSYLLIVSKKILIFLE